MVVVVVVVVVFGVVAMIVIVVVGLCRSLTFLVIVSRLDVVAEAFVVLVVVVSVSVLMRVCSLCFVS